MRAFTEPIATAYTLARDTLNAVLASNSSRAPSLVNNFLAYLSFALSGQVLPGYATLDFSHVQEIQRFLTEIRKYAIDATQRRPLNFLMLAFPGAGKSHFIDCVAKYLGKEAVGAVTFNMVGLQQHEDLVPPLEAIRNFKIDDRLPLLFLDEFDANPDMYPLLLPLLWDGQLTVGRQDLKLGKIVVVLAGSSPKLPLMMEKARSMQPDLPLDPDHPKIIDLLSRINGAALNLPPLTSPRAKADRIADKACIAGNLLRKRFGNQLERVPLSLLKFIAMTDFRYSVRSIAHLVNSISYAPSVVDLLPRQLGLPFETEADLAASSLAYHVMHEEQARGITAMWKELTKNEALILVNHESVDYTLQLARREHPPSADFILELLWNDFARATRAKRKQ